MAKADFLKAKANYRSTSMGIADWVEVFDEHPDIMWTILADVYNVVVDEQEREAGIHRIGRRPFRAAGSVEQLMTAVFPDRWSLEGFPVALKKLIGDRSQRAFAMKIPVNQSTLSRLLAGSLKPDMAMMESIARAAKVHPTFFLEYRGLFMAELVREVFVAQPNLGITAVKRLRGQAARRAA